jgi:hypothetical protein
VPVVIVLDFVVFAARQVVALPVKFYAMATGCPQQSSTSLAWTLKKALPCSGGCIEVFDTYALRALQQLIAKALNPSGDLLLFLSRSQ